MSPCSLPRLFSVGKHHVLIVYTSLVPVCGSVGSGGECHMKHSNDTFQQKIQDRVAARLFTVRVWDALLMPGYMLDLNSTHSSPCWPLLHCRVIQSNNPSFLVGSHVVSRHGWRTHTLSGWHRSYTGCFQSGLRTAQCPWPWEPSACLGNAKPPVDSVSKDYWWQLWCVWLSNGLNGTNPKWGYCRSAFRRST